MPSEFPQQVIPSNVRTFYMSRWWIADWFVWGKFYWKSHTYHMIQENISRSYRMDFPYVPKLYCITCFKCEYTSIWDSYIYCNDIWCPDTDRESWWQEWLLDAKKSVTILIVYLLLFTWFLNTAPYFDRNFMTSLILKTDKIDMKRKPSHARLWETCYFLPMFSWSTRFLLILWNKTVTIPSLNHNTPIKTE